MNGTRDGQDSGAERRRLREDEQRIKNWKRWGPYLAERQWGTVREDYSADGDCWAYFPHDHARSRAYRWGEDGLLGLTDRECRLCLALALWNEQDPILKERLYGLAGPEGNHGEDCKELYYYLDAVPTFAYARALYKYPQAAFPYESLRRINADRSRSEPEYEIEDTGVFDSDRYFDVFAEYAKAAPDDILVRFTIENRGPETAILHVIPVLWFRNTWIWGCEHEGCTLKPRIWMDDATTLGCDHESLNRFTLSTGLDPHGNEPEFLFTENETNTRRLFHEDTYTPYVKDALNEAIVNKRPDAVNPDAHGTKAGIHYRIRLDAGSRAVIPLRLYAGEKRTDPFGDAFDQLFNTRSDETDAFYAGLAPAENSADETRIQRQAYAGLLWSRQFYHYSVKDWLRGDPAVGTPPDERLAGRNTNWQFHLFNRDVLSMPDKWEYPWFAAWDLAFHMIPFARLDPHFAKQQLLLLLREWYMHPNGQIPAYEFAFDDVNPPVHAWACWRVYTSTASHGQRDIAFLARVFQKLMINFTWWVNRKDPHGLNLFAGGFLGLDNIGVFDRSKPLPTGGHLEQADGTAWMAFYCLTMLSMAIELAVHDSAYEDVASKFFEHFIAIADAMNTLGGSGLWNEQDGFYHDQLHLPQGHVPLEIRSMVGLVPLFAVEILDGPTLDRLPGFRKRMDWFLEHRQDLARHIAYMECRRSGTGRHLLAIPNRDRLLKVLKVLFDENEFLSPYGIRSLSRFHADHPYVFHHGGDEHVVEYQPGESRTGLFGGNSNWRGPVWFPMNFLIIEALQRYHYYYGDSLKVEYPTGSGNRMTLDRAARDLAARLVGIFSRNETGRRPCHGLHRAYADDPAFRNLLLFHEYFHADSGEGLGASHQTGWTALVTTLIDMIHTRRTSNGDV